MTKIFSNNSYWNYWYPKINEWFNSIHRWYV